MQVSGNIGSLRSMANREHIKNLIDRSLLGNWSIRIEYSGSNLSGQREWILWGKTFFAIRSPSMVLNALDACHANFPTQDIRLYAENNSPQTRMVYTVYSGLERE